MGLLGQNSTRLEQTLVSSYARALGSTSLFAGVRPGQLEQLAQSCRHKRHRKGAVVVVEGDQGRSLYIILTGRVGIRSTNEVGDFVYLAERGAGECFGEMSLFGGRPRSNDVVALEDSEFLILEQESFLRALTSHPEIGMKIIEYLSDRLREAGRGLVGSKSVRVRLAHYLWSLVERAASEDSKGRIMLQLDGTRQEIAERIRARRETVSRELTALQGAGLIRVAGRNVLILDPKRLERIANCGNS